MKYKHFKQALLFKVGSVVPFVNGTHLIISLNSQKNNKDLPDSQYLKYHSRYIPGTFIDCKIYITDNFVENIENEDN